jgi:CheY-like chemotaxis protein
MGSSPTPLPPFLTVGWVSGQPIGLSWPLVPSDLTRPFLHLAFPPVAAPFPIQLQEHRMSMFGRDETKEGVRRAMATILLIDDDDQVRMLFQVALAGAGYRVLVAENGKHGLRLLERQEVDLILVDILMPDIDGLELIPRLRRMQPACKIIAMSGGSGEWDPLRTAKHLGANDTLKKPFGPQELLEMVASQLT